MKLRDLKEELKEFGVMYDEFEVVIAKSFNSGTTKLFEVSHENMLGEDLVRSNSDRYEKNIDKSVIVLWVKE